MTSRVGLPAFLVSSKFELSGSEGGPLFGAWCSWNVLLRELHDAVIADKITEEHFLAISSWVASHIEFEGEVTLPPQKSALSRFGGQLSDEEYDSAIGQVLVQKAITVDQDLFAREKAKNERKAKAGEKPPSLSESIRSMTDPEGVTFFNVATFPANRNQYWVARIPHDRLNPFYQRVAGDLGENSLPGSYTATSVVISPDENTKKANKLLGKGVKSAPKKTVAKKQAKPIPKPVKRLSEDPDPSLATLLPSKIKKNKKSIPALNDMPWVN